MRSAQEYMERKNYFVLKITDSNGLREAEKTYRLSDNMFELFPLVAQGSYNEVAEKIVPDRNAKYGEFGRPLILFSSFHPSHHGMSNVCETFDRILEQAIDAGTVIDKLSISAHIAEDGRIQMVALMRLYTGSVNFMSIFNELNDPAVEIISTEKEVVKGELVIPEGLHSPSEQERAEYAKELEEQTSFLQEHEDDNIPPLNLLISAGKSYLPPKIHDDMEYSELIYDLKTADMKIKISMDYADFIQVFEEVMNYVNGPEYFTYLDVIEGTKKEDEFMNMVMKYVNDNFVATGRLNVEDTSVLRERLYNALFRMYVIQDLIDDPLVTDIKVTGPKAIRARVKGKAYLSNITFIDEKDFRRFVNAICKRNNIQMNVPDQTFSDDRDEAYKFRFSLSAEYVNCEDYPYLHIRKISKKKLLRDDLIKAGMLNDTVADYILAQARTAKGVLFVGPPGSGKTVALNWFLEEGYEASAEILVIQENDELFAEKRTGVMFKHVVNYPKEDTQKPVTLADLSRMALVAGANVFIIGEAKGAEICDAITLGNSGCRISMTLHCNNEEETVDKCADLAMRGFAKDFNQAKRMVSTAFDTIVYLEDFKVKSISKIVGYDEQKNVPLFKKIYSIKS